MGLKDKKEQELLYLFKCFPVQNDPIWFSDKGYFEKRGKNRVLHAAIDIFGYRGNPILTTCECYVPSKVKIRSGGKTLTIAGSGYSKKGGNYVFLVPADKEFQDFRFYNAHLDKLDAIAMSHNIVIPRATPVGTMGNTGNAIKTKVHLHHQIKYKNIYLDPAMALNHFLQLEHRTKHRLDKTKCR